ncbi:MAG TPA: MMPL family transporter, partial [Solirubrobacterales bacterium]|nr:MMPL family transporter [Solirubrobacterales bacterium]
MTDVGPIGRLGRYTATHFRVVVIAWVGIALLLGFLAPRVEKALSGAGWEASGSQSVQARHLINQNFNGLSAYGLMVVVHSPSATVGDPSFASTLGAVERKLRADNAVRTVVPPRPGASISPDGHTAIVQTGVAKDSNAMVKAAEDLKGPLTALGRDGVQVHLTGASGM